MRTVRRLVNAPWNKVAKSRKREVSPRIWAIQALEPRLLLSTAVSNYHNDASSSGQNLTETALTTADVNATQFGKLLTTAVDGQVYAQPLYIPGLNITAGPDQGVHNVVFVATENDSLYAIDANSGVVLWQDSFITTDPALTAGGASVVVTPVIPLAVSSNDINPEIGTTATPVIDTATGQLFLTAQTEQIVNGDTDEPHFVITLDEVNIHTGASDTVVIGDTAYNTDKGDTYTYTSGPYVLDPAGNGGGVSTAIINGQTQNVIYFNAMRALQRSALTLYDGNVYMAFASHGDAEPYHGWILGFNESTLAPTAVLNLDPNGSDTGIWMGGGEIAIDPQGYFYVETGNGTFDTTLNAQGFPIDGDYGDSFVKIALDPTTSVSNQNINGWGMKVVDYFTPLDQAALATADEDLGSGGPMILPDTAGSITIGSASAPDLLVGSGKGGTIYLINRDNMGKYSPTTDNVVQEISGALKGGGSFGTPAFYYDGTTAWIYYAGLGDDGRAFTIANGVITATASITSQTFGARGATPSISANGDSNGILWAIDAGTSELRAYNASDLTQLLYSTAQNSARDALGTAIKFTVPTVADGLVFVGTSNALVIYGLISPPNAPPPAPINASAQAVSDVQINVSWTDTATDALGYYVQGSTDGGNTWTRIATTGPSASSDDATGLTPSTSYEFRVQAYNALGTSAFAYTSMATTLSPPTPPSFPSGFAGAASQLTLSGSAAFNGDNLELTDGNANEAGSAFTDAAISVDGFNTVFDFQLVSAIADGFTFTIQDSAPSALGGDGGGLGYANVTGNGGIPNSVCIKFDLFNNAGEGVDSTGLFVDGDSPTEPSGASLVETSIDMTSSGIDLHSGDIMQVNLNYNGTLLQEVVTDTLTSAMFVNDYLVNIPATIGGAMAYVGFTGGTSSPTAIQNILNWTYTPVAALPYTPTDLTVTPASGTELDLSWLDSLSSVSTFNILQLINGVYEQVGQVAGNMATYQSTGLDENTTYSYEVVAVNSVGSSEPTAPISGTTPYPPADASNLTASQITTSTVVLNWQDNATNATGYRITRQLESDNSEYVTTLPSTATSYSDSGLIPGCEYDYELEAINLAGPSAGIDVIVETVPTAPTGVSAAAGGEQILLSWTAEGHAVSSYNIYRGNTSGGESPTPIATNVTGNTFTDINVLVGQTYFYEITAVDTGGESAPSMEVSAAPLIATQSGSTLLVNFNGAGNPMSLSGAGGAITVASDGQFQSFAGITSIVVNGSPSDDVLSTTTTLGVPLTFLNGAVDTLNVVNGSLTLAAAPANSGTQNVNLATLSISSAASLTLAEGNAESGITQLNINNLQLSGKLNLTDNTLSIDYGKNPSPLSTVSALIRSGFNNGLWNGTGIDSSYTATNHGAGGIGYADGTLDTSTSAAPNTILVRYTLLGDSNLDGVVNLTDLLALLNHYGQSNSDWADGDYNYDGTVNLTDLLALLNNYQLSIQSQSDSNSLAAEAIVLTPTQNTSTPSPGLPGGAGNDVVYSSNNFDDRILGSPKLDLASGDDMGSVLSV